MDGGRGAKLLVHGRGGFFKVFVIPFGELINKNPL